MPWLVQLFTFMANLVFTILDISDVVNWFWVWF